jgi:hypothetical protein
MVTGLAVHALAFALLSAGFLLAVVLGLCAPIDTPAVTVFKRVSSGFALIGLAFLVASAVPA